MVNRKDFMQNSNQMTDFKIHNPIILSKLRDAFKNFLADFVC